MRPSKPVLLKDSRPPLADTMVLAAWAWVSDVSMLASKNYKRKKKKISGCYAMTYLEKKKGEERLAASELSIRAMVTVSVEGLFSTETACLIHSIHTNR